jgi:hypothetical protein
MITFSLLRLLSTGSIISRMAGTESLLAEGLFLHDDTTLDSLWTLNRVCSRVVHGKGSKLR